MGCLALLLPLVIILPLVILLLVFNVVTISFGKLGLTPPAALTLFLLTLIGSMINIPVSRRRIPYQEPPRTRFSFFFFRPPPVTAQTIAVNMGGAIIPTVMALYLIPRAEPVPTLISTAIVVLVTWKLARVVPGVGIAMPGFIPPLLAVGLAYLLARDNPAPVAYIAGTMGTLIGADLLNWPKFKTLGTHLISIGGAGVFDGIFLSGLIAALLA